MVHVVLLIPARAAAPPSDVNKILADEGYRRAKAVVNSLGLLAPQKTQRNPALHVTKT
jgi:hypothetical protein